MVKKKMNQSTKFLLLPRRMNTINPWFHRLAWTQNNFSSLNLPQGTAGGKRRRKPQSLSMDVRFISPYSKETRKLRSTSPRTHPFFQIKQHYQVHLLSWSVNSSDLSWSIILRHLENTSFLKSKPKDIWNYTILRGTGNVVSALLCFILILRFELWSNILMDFLKTVLLPYT